MRRFTFTLAIVITIAYLPATAGEGEFFNGKDLTGWQGLEQYWKASDGALVGDTQPDGLKFNTFLCSKKEYGNFELRFKVRLKGGKGNSGVQIRSELINERRFVVKGPQCDIGDIYWGSLYGERFGGMMQQADSKLVKEVLKPDQFNDYSIRCVGKRVTILLNGKTTVDQEFEKMPEKGIIAFQVHSGPAMEVMFRDIQFKELP